MKITKRQLRRIIKEELGRRPTGSGVRIEDDGYITRVTLIGPESLGTDPGDAEGQEEIEWETGDIASPQLAAASARWGDLEIVDDPRGLADTGIPMSVWLKHYIEEFE